MIPHQNQLISIIIPCKNHAMELRDCLNALRLSGVGTPHEIIVVDSAGSPDVATTVSEFPKVKLIRSQSDLDAGTARNLGVKHSSGAYLAFIDADCIPCANWISAALSALRQGSCMAGGPVSDALPDHPVASADNICQFSDLRPFRPQGLIDMLPACNLAVRRESFDRIGGFPLVLNIEDVFFTNRVSSRWPGLCRFVPEMHVAHKGRSTLAEFWRHQYRFGHQRGFFGFRLTKAQQNIGRWRIAVPMIVLKRLIYIFQRIAAWNRNRFGWYIIISPLIVYGLIGWAMGFQLGCRRAHMIKQAVISA